MSLEIIFKILNFLALAGWVALIASNWLNQVEKVVSHVIITLLAIAYVYLIFSNFHPSDTQRFSTLGGIKQLFSNDNLLLAGWVHYLAFDLLTGCFIAKNARINKITFWLILPCLLFTFMLGPFGLLLYFLIRWIMIKQYFTPNF